MKRGLAYQILTLLLSFGLKWVTAENAGENVFGIEQKAERPFAEVLHLSECGEFITSLVITAEGDVLVGDEDHGISRWDGVQWHRYLDRGAGVRNVYALAAGPSGTLWVGTQQDGVHAVSGGSAKQFTLADGFPGRRIFALHVDSTERVWCGHDRGLSVYANSAWRHWNIGDGVPGLPVTAVAVDRAGNAWIGTASHGVAVLEAEGSLRLGPREGLKDRRINCLTFDAAGRLWAGTANGLGMLPKERTRWTWIQNLVPSTQANFGVALPAGLSKENDRPLFAGDDYVTGLLANPDGTLLVGTRMGGVRRVTIEEDGAAEVEEAVKVPESYISRMARDPSGRLWIGTYGAGLFEIVPAIECFQDSASCLVTDRRFTAAFAGTRREAHDSGGKASTVRPLWCLDHQALIQSIGDLGKTFRLGRVARLADGQRLALHFWRPLPGPDEDGRRRLARVLFVDRATGRISSGATTPSRNMRKSRVPAWLPAKDWFDTKNDETTKGAADRRKQRFLSATGGTFFQEPEEAILVGRTGGLSLSSKNLEAGDLYLLTFTISTPPTAPKESPSEAVPQVEVIFRQDQHFAGPFVIDRIPEEDLRIPYFSLSSSPVKVGFNTPRHGPPVQITNVSLKPFKGLLESKGPFSQSETNDLDESLRLTALDEGRERKPEAALNPESPILISPKLITPPAASQRSQQAFSLRLTNGKLDVPLSSPLAPQGRYLSDLRISRPVEVSYALLAGTKGSLSEQCGNVALASWDEGAEDWRLLAWERAAPNFCHLLTFPRGTLRRIRLIVDHPRFTVSEIRLGLISPQTQPPPPDIRHSSSVRGAD